MLESYTQKRDFERTPEPEAAVLPSPRGSLRFVVQKHAARRLHYDFRLEVDGVLKSWPIPRGPSLNPDDKRLAVMVEDHPLDYGTFEGVIPKGEYGAGHVIVWDAGVYSPDEGGQLSFSNRDEANERIRGELDAGKLSFTLRGHKLRGSWTLVSTTREPNEWLLIKHKDRYADDAVDLLEDDRSVLSGLTIADLKTGRLPDPARKGFSAGSLTVGQPVPFPSTLKPMLARTDEKPFSDPQWLFEPKLDGFRAVAFVSGGAVTLRSRTGNDMTEPFSDVVGELAALPEEELVLDGELVALDENGLPDFTLLQHAAGLPDMIKMAHPSGPATVVYYPFDLLHANGRDLQGLPLVERKALLAQLVVPGEAVRLMEYVEGEGEAFFGATVGMGLEGMVAKRLDSTYQPGTRSPSWVKIKHFLSQEFVVGGYTRGEGSRSKSFGSLLLGYYEGSELRYAGKAGSGFVDSMLDHLRGVLADLAMHESTFVNEDEIEDEAPSWVRPELVVEVKFSEWTHEGRLRAPVFLRLKPDVQPRAVVRETAQAAVPSDNGVRESEEDSERSSTREVLDQLAGDGEQMTVEVEGHRVSLTNLNKEFWPASEGWRPLTKRDMIAYYTRMAWAVLPHLRDRPLTLTRYPNGIAGDSFYQKNWEHKIPEFVATVKLYSSRNERDAEYVMVNNLPTLIWLAQLADLELHPWLSRTVAQPDASNLSTTFTGSRDQLKGSVLNYPDYVVFDLDPYIYSGQEDAGDEPELNRRAFAKTAEIALALKDVLDELSLSSLLKTSGKTGLHVYVPVLRRYDYGVTRKTCELIGRFLLQRRPKDVTMEWTVSKRAGKIFLDHNQNIQGKNMASIYSLRPLPGAPVSTPIRWDEVGDIYPTDFNIDTALERVESLGDLWADALSAKHDLRRLLAAD